MSSTINTSELKSLINACDLGGLLGTPDGFDFTVRRLIEFLARYGEHRSHHGTASSLPLEQGWVDLHRQSEVNLHRVRVLLQAVAFMCSAEMLAMLWMVQLGSSVKEVHVDHVRESQTKVVVLLDLPGVEQLTERFESTEHWDLALLQFVTISKVNDGLPVVESFHALKLQGP